MAYKLITAICTDRYKEQPNLFDSPVGIKQGQDRDYLEENSILKNNCWDDFVKGIIDFTATISIQTSCSYFYGVL